MKSYARSLLLASLLTAVGCGGDLTPFVWPTDSAGIAALAMCGNGNVVCPEGDMCSDGEDCFPFCPGTVPVGSCADIGNCGAGLVCVHALCVAWAGSPECMQIPPNGAGVLITKPHPLPLDRR